MQKGNADAIAQNNNRCSTFWKHQTSTFVIPFSRKNNRRTLDYKLFLLNGLRFSWGKVVIMHPVLTYGICASCHDLESLLILERQSGTLPKSSSMTGVLGHEKLVFEGEVAWNMRESRENEVLSSIRLNSRSGCSCLHGGSHTETKRESKWANLRGTSSPLGTTGAR